MVRFGRDRRPRPGVAAAAGAGWASERMGMSRAFGRIGTALLAVAAVGAVAAAAHRYYTSYRPPVNPRAWAAPDSLAYSAGTGRQHSPPVSTQPNSSDPLAGLAEDLRDPTGRRPLAAIGGLHVLDTDPEGVPAPPDARRLNAFRQDSPAGRQELARYLVATSPNVVESFYADRLARSGWQPVGRARDGSIVYRRGRQDCLLRLSPAKDNTELTVVVWTMPEQEPGS